MPAISSRATGTGSTRMAARSPPAMKAAPSAEMCTARTRGSAAMAAQAAWKPCAMVTSMALSERGRLKRSCATAPSRQHSTLAAVSLSRSG